MGTEVRIVGGEPAVVNTGGSYSHARGDAEAQATPGVAHQEGEVSDSGDILSTMRRTSGAPIPPARGDAQSIVRYRGYDMKVEQAIQLGAPIERDAAGGYRQKGDEGDAAQAAAASTSPPISSGTENDAGMSELANDYGLAAEEVQAAQSIEQAVGPRIIDALAETIITEGVDALDKAMTGQAITRAGLSKEAHAVVDGLQREGDRAVNALGVEPSEFYTWARQYAKKDLHAAMREHFDSGDARCYEKLVGRFKSAGHV